MNEQKYICAICGKEYDSVKSRIECESACYKNYLAVEARKKADEVKMKREASEKAIEAKLAEVDKMLKEHLEEYETFHFSRRYSNLTYIFKNMLWF